MNNPAAANVLGTMGAVCWSIQLIPQIVINYRRHNTEGLQKSMMMLWAVAGAPLAIYNVVRDFNIALKIQPQILTILSLITWSQCYYYGEEWPIYKCAALAVPVACFMGGMEAALILALRIAQNNGITWPSAFMAALAGFLLCTGVATHYKDIYLHRSVRGISFLFVGIDAAGDLFSLASVVFEPTLDIAGMVVYASEFTLWSGVFACGFYFNLIPWMKLKLREDILAITEGELEDYSRSAREDGGTVFEPELEAVHNRSTGARAASSTSGSRRSLESIASGTSSSRSVFRTVSGELAIRRLHSLQSSINE